MKISDLIALISVLGPKLPKAWPYIQVISTALAEIYKVIAQPATPTPTPGPNNPAFASGNVQKAIAANPALSQIDPAALNEVFGNIEQFEQQVQP